MLKNILEKQNIYNIYIKAFTQNMTKYYFDLEDMKKTFSSFKDKMTALTQLQENDKLSFDNNNKIYIDRGHYLQSFKRWYYGESRDVTHDKLSIIFNDYNKYLMMVNRSLYNQPNYSFYDLADNVYLFNKDLIKGLNNLKNTYNNVKEYNEKLSLLIPVIIEYIGQFEELYVIRCNSRSNKY